MLMGIALTEIGKPVPAIGKNTRRPGDPLADYGWPELCVRIIPESLSSDKKSGIRNL
jgi:hypothetical protein